MSTYAKLTDITDTAIRANQALLNRAEAAVNIEIAGRGYDVELIESSTPFLKELTVLMVGKIACFEQANGAESPLIKKYEDYIAEIDRLLLSISHQALGITDPLAQGGVYVAVC